MSIIQGNDGDEVVRAITEWRDAILAAVERKAAHDRREVAELEALAALLGVT